MIAEHSFIETVREAARKRILFLRHALDRMNSPERMITRAEVRQVVFHGDLIEDYPDDVRSYSCLLLGFGQVNRPIHVVCAPKRDYLAIITVYLPDTARWKPDFRKRKE